MKAHPAAIVLGDKRKPLMSSFLIIMVRHIATQCWSSQALSEWEVIKQQPIWKKTQQERDVKKNSLAYFAEALWTQHLWILMISHMKNSSWPGTAAVGRDCSGQTRHCGYKAHNRQVSRQAFLGLFFIIIIILMAQSGH